MSSDINRVTLTGRLTKDAEVGVTSAGKPNALLRIAFNRRSFKDGQWGDEPNFIDARDWNSARVQSLEQRGYYVKGARCTISGELRWREWVDSSTQKKREKIEISIDEIIFHRVQEAEPKPQVQVETPAIAADDIPF